MGAAALLHSLRNVVRIPAKQIAALHTSAPVQKMGDYTRVCLERLNTLAQEQKRAATTFDDSIDGERLMAELAEHGPIDEGEWFMQAQLPIDQATARVSEKFGIRLVTYAGLCMAADMAGFDPITGKLVVLRRLDNGLLALPGGFSQGAYMHNGAMTGGESLKETAMREFHEETGGTIKEETVRLINEYSNPTRDTRGNKQIATVVYAGEVASDRFKPQASEVREVITISEDELGKMDEDQWFSDHKRIAQETFEAFFNK